ncbi:MAG: hypothetical protein D6B25_04390 [Desulfobulbaceae bacterium]|nr:MAG: hypothetical protein D6B25_04390 [Desulfobulbaceae bacterium]
MLKKYQRIVPENLWNRLARNLIYDSKQLLLYCGIKLPRQPKAAEEYAELIKRFTSGTQFGIICDPITSRIHFEPEYIQNIIDQATRFDFPVYDKSFGPGGVAGYISEGDRVDEPLKNPDLNDILRQAILAQNNEMPFSYVSARQLSLFETEQFSVMTRIFDGPIFFPISTLQGVDEAQRYLEDGNYVIAIQTVFQSPLTFSFKEKIEVFIDCVSRGIPISLVTQPFSGQSAPMTPYGLAVLAFSEFLAGMALAYSINPDTKIINGALPTMCTPGNKPKLKLGSVVHNYVNYLVSYTSRLLDIASIQSGCTMEGAVHEPTILETDYQTARAMILWENLFEGWHMIRHTYGFLSDMASFSFTKAEADITALRHIQSLDENGINAILANNVKLNRDYNRAQEIYETPTLIFQREDGSLVDVIIETVEHFNGDFGRHEHTLKNVPVEWF